MKIIVSVPLKGSVVLNGFIDGGLNHECFRPLKGVFCFE